MDCNPERLPDSPRWSLLRVQRSSGEALSARNQQDVLHLQFRIRDVGKSPTFRPGRMSKGVIASGVRKFPIMLPLFFNIAKGLILQIKI